MKTLAQSLTVSAAVYSLFFILLASLMAFGSGTETNPPAADAMQVSFYLEEEAYVDDIPFNTEAIAEKALFEQAMAADYDLEEESYIEDIPFNTAKIAEERLADLASAK